MNRIKLSPLASSPVDQQEPTKKPSVKPHFKSDSSVARAEHEINLFVPLHYESTYAYPLIVWLHDEGQATDQLNRLMPEISMRNYVGVAPQGPVGNFQCGYFWDQDYDAAEAAEDAIFKAIQTATQRFNIAENRIFLAGLGSGASMALRVGLRHPEAFGGIVALDGPVPTGQNVFLRWQAARQLPIFWAHHQETCDGGSSPEAMCQHFKDLFAAGFVNMVAREYPTRKHLEALTMPEINRWIMEQIQTAIA